MSNRDGAHLNDGRCVNSHTSRLLRIPVQPGTGPPVPPPHSARNSFRQRVQPFKQPACSQSSHHLRTSATTKVAVRPASPQCLGMRTAACVVVFLLSFLEFAMAQDHVTPFLDQVRSFTLMSATPADLPFFSPFSLTGMWPDSLSLFLLLVCHAHNQCLLLLIF